MSFWIADTANVWRRACGETPREIAARLAMRFIMRCAEREEIRMRSLTAK